MTTWGTGKVVGRRRSADGDTSGTFGRERPQCRQAVCVARVVLFRGTEVPRFHTGERRPDVSGRDENPRRMGGALPRNCAGHDISCPYGRKAKSPARRRRYENQRRVGGALPRKCAGHDISCPYGRKAKSPARRRRYENQRRVGGVLPRRFAGHDISCPYGRKAKSPPGRQRYENGRARCGLPKCRRRGGAWRDRPGRAWPARRESAS